MLFKRKAEIEKQLRGARTVVARPDAPVAMQENAIDKMFENYFIARERVLTEALQFLRDETVRTPEQHRIRWETHIDKMHEQLRMINDFARKQDVSPYTTAVINILTQESKFFWRIANMPFPDIMCGKLRNLRAQYYEEKYKLLGKWEKMKADNTYVNANIEEASVKAMTIYKDMLKKSLTAKDLLRTNFKKLLVVAKVGLKLIDVELKKEILTPLNTMVDELNRFMPGSKELISRMDNLYRNEDNTAIIVFGETRKSVKDFLENTNLEKITKEYQNANKLALENAANLPTEGQQADGKIFAELAEQLTAQVLTSYTDAYNGFVNEFKEIFIGPVGGRTVNTLIQKERWDRTKQEYKDLNIQGELLKMYTETTNFIEVQMNVFGDIHPDSKALIQESLKADFARLEIALSVHGDRNVFDSLVNYFTLIKDLTLGRAEKL